MVVRYEYVPDVLARRAPHREGHLAHWAPLVTSGHLCLGGALDPPSDGALLILRGVTAEAITEKIRDDPYVTAGLVPSHTVTPWNVVIGADLKK